MLKDKPPRWSDSCFKKQEVAHLQGHIELCYATQTQLRTVSVQHTVYELV